MEDHTELVLPEGTRLVHIGPHKTGSTAIQVALFDLHERLVDYGVACPGRTRRARMAGWALGLPARRAGLEQPPIKRWENFAAEVAACGEARVCVSNEDFGRAQPEKIRRIVDDLGGDRVHVVAVVRGLQRYLPSQWQERIKADVAYAWEDWLRIVLDPHPTTSSDERWNVWFAHDVEALVGRWTDVVGADRFTLIVSDDHDRTLLPRTFEGLLGLPSGLLNPPAGRSNESLSWDRTELLRSVQVAFDEQGLSRAGRAPWTRAVRNALLNSDVPPSDPRTPPYPAWAIERIRDLSEKRADAVRRSGVHVIGDPANLLVDDSVSVGSPDALPPMDPRLPALATEALVRATVKHPGLTAADFEDGQVPERLLGDQDHQADSPLPRRVAGRVRRRIGRRPTSREK